MKISVLTINFFSGKFTELLVRSIVNLNSKHEISISIFDNGSSDGSLEFVNSWNNQQIMIFSEDCPYNQGSFSHGFAVDHLINNTELGEFDALLLIDSDCFSLQKNWLDKYLELSIENDLDIIGAPAFCPNIEEVNRYFWPGFSFYSPKAIGMIIDKKLSFMPNNDYHKVNDSGQFISDCLTTDQLNYKYLQRTEPMKIGSVQLEKWSIDNRIHHFFAASMAFAARNPFSYIYNDKSRGTYIQKRLKAWKLFRQQEIKQLMSVEM